MKASRHQGIQAANGYTIDGVTYVAGRSLMGRQPGGLRLAGSGMSDGVGGVGGGRLDETLSWSEALEAIGCRGRSKDTFKRITTEGAISGGERIVLATVPRPGGHRVTVAAIQAFIAAFEAAAKRKSAKKTHGGRLDVRG